MFNLYDESDRSFLQHKYDEVPDEGHFFKHIHNNCEVHLFLSGSADFNLEGAVFKLDPYDLVLIPPQTYHSLILKNLVPYERFVFNFPCEKYPIDTERIFSAPKVINIANEPALLGVFERMKSYSESLSEADFSAMAHLLVQELLLLIGSGHGASAIECPPNSLTADIVQFINENLSRPLAVSDVAERFHLSPSHVQNVFNGNMKIGLKSFILRKKMARAKELLKGGCRPGDAAAALGFSDYTTFYKNFVAIHGHSPKHYTK